MQQLVITVVKVTILVALIASEVLTESCTENDIRLDGGRGKYEGNVQICNNKTWGYICSNKWDHNDATVACRQLGYSVLNAVYKINSYYRYGNGTIWLDYMNCKGNEKKLIDCSHKDDIGVIRSNCWYGNVAGVFCPYGGSCTRGDIRLATFYPNSYGISEGRVEVCYNNKWGTVCNTWWNSADVRVACRQLGYGGDHYNYWLNYGAGSGSIWLGRCDCRGSESRLIDCRLRSSIGNTGCNHNQDVGIRCFGYENKACVNGQYRLWSAYDSTPASEGVLQICYSGRWYSACHYSSCYLAKKACISLGYKGAVATRSNGGFYYGYFAYNDNRYYRCNSNLHCWTDSWWWYRYYYCNGAYYRALGVVCYDHDTKKDYCTSGDVRLRGGETDNEGRVEYCYDDYWSPVCSLNSYTAHLMCKKLGYKKYSWGKILSHEEFGRSSEARVFNYVYCTSSHTDLSKCHVYTKGSGCFIQPVPCGTEYGLRCFDPGECDDGEVRLMNGTIEQEGRAEVCVNGVWSSICGYSWSQTDGYTVCKQLGYDGPNPIAYYLTKFGQGRGPVIWSNVYCGGWERSIFECSKLVYPKFDCHYNYEAGITCKEWCDDGDVRLADGNFDNEGTVEVCFDNLWGQISDSGWTSADAKVVCNELGHKNGIAKAILGSHYGSSDKIIHLKDVACTGTEDNLAECTKTQLPFAIGKSAVEDTDVAGVDCIFDIYTKPTEPPCIARDEANPIEKCTTTGSLRLVNGSSDYEGRVEYCHNMFWTPLCTMDNKVARVACKQLGLTQYSWGSVLINGEYGNVMNYTTVDSITCSGVETELSHCSAKTSASCLPWCPDNNIGLKCFDSTECEEGTTRIMDGVIEQEGRVEVCLNGVWGTICDKGWDKSDAHVVCQQLGLSESEPITFYNSHFGGGYYPIVYSNLKCGGWEDALSDCQKEDYLQVNCSRDDLAGIFCGYNCEHGDVRLVGGSKDSEGTVETCLNNFWGLINEAGWSDNDAQVVCRELGYEVKGTVAYFDSHYGKPNKPVLVTDVLCDGEEESLRDCTQKEYSFHEGKQKLQEVEVAGVKCFVPDTCVDPPEGGKDCEDGALRLTGQNAKDDEGSLEYCYKGLWSKFCSLGEREAAVACKQLGFKTDVAAVYSDGRYDSKSNSSLFLKFTCGDLDSTSKSNFSECTLNDTCRSTCSKTSGIKCYTSDGCSDGSLRLMSGGLSNGRVEVCYNNVWGSVCGKDFDHTDAYVVCKELGRGVSEPTVTTTSSYGDGGLAIVYGEVNCKGYEPKLQDCSRKGFGDFSCFHNNTVGIICQDDCNDGDIRLVGGKKGVEGSVETCYDNLWGLVASVNWDNKDATVVCYQMGYVRTGSTAYTQSEFGKPEKTVHLSNVKCKGSEKSLEKCSREKISLDEGEKLFKWIEVAGVSCNSTLRPTATIDIMTATVNNNWTEPSTSKKARISPPSVPIASVAGAVSQHLQENGMTVGMSLFAVILIIIVVAVVAVVIIVLRRKWLKKKGTNGDQVQLSNIYEEKSFDIYGDDPTTGDPITGDPITDGPITDEDVKKDLKEPPKTGGDEEYY